jgi:hypothetical protein
MFRRKNSGLPTTGSLHGVDGSGKAVHMDAPLWRAWKNADGYIKGTYIFLVLSIMLMIFGYRQLRYHNSSIWLTCTAEECNLQITPTGRRGTLSVDFARKQLLAAETIKVDPDGNFVKLDDSDPFKYSYRNKKGKNKYRPGFEKGPDKEGNYDSYHLILEPLKDENQADTQKDNDDSVPVSDFEAIKEYTNVDENGRLVLHMRRFNLGETRRRTRIMTNKVDAYVKKRRHKLFLKENAGLSFFGIFGMILGLFILCLTVLLGQFVEEPPRRKQGGPGARRKPPVSQQKRSNLTYTKSASGSTRTVRKAY